MFSDTNTATTLAKPNHAKSTYRDSPTYRTGGAFPRRTERAIEFPIGRSCGVVIVRTEKDWHEIGPAQGVVFVPAEAEVGVRWRPQADLTGLNWLEPSDLSFFDLGGASLDDESLHAVARFRSLKKLDLSWSTLTDGQVGTLTALQHLEELSLNHCRIGDESAFTIAQLPCLRSLSLRGTQVGDFGVSALASLNKLEELNLAATKITDLSLEIIGGLPSLIRLDLGGNAWPRLTAAGLQALASAQCLVSLSLGWTDLPADAIRELRSLRRLEEIDLSGTRVDDNALASLSDVPIKRLTLCAASAVTNLGLTELRRSTTLEHIEIHQSVADNFGVFALWAGKPTCVVNGLSQATWCAGALRGRWSAGDPIITPAV